MVKKAEYGSNIYIKRKSIDDEIVEEKKEEPKKERKGVSFKKKIKKRL